MSDVERELQKLRALINQRQTTAIFSNKSNESTKISSGDTELFINDMSKRFSFTSAGVRNPVALDPRERAIYNLDYLNGAKVSDITGTAFEIEELRDITSTHAELIAKCEYNITKNTNDISTHNGRINGCETELGTINEELTEHSNELVQQSMRISELEKAEGSTEIINSMIQFSRYKNMRVTWTYDDSMPGYIRITFVPAFTVDNFRANRRDVLVRCTLSNGIVWEPQFQKYWDDESESYKLDLRGGELNNGVLTYYHGYTSATTKEVIVYDGILVTSIEGLKDMRFANAIVESTRYGMTDALITGEEDDEALDFTYTFDQNNTSACVVTFSTPIYDDCVIAGNYSWIDYELANGQKHTVYYTRARVDAGYATYWGSCSWDSTRKICTINHGRGYQTVSVSVRSERFIKSKQYTITDNRLTQAIVNSVANELTTQTIRPCPFRNWLVDFLYPIGSLYVSFDKTSPADRFGVGTWEKIVNRFLYCADGSGATGGSRKITIENMPKHRHTFTGNTVNGKLYTMHSWQQEGKTTSPFSESEEIGGGYSTDNNYHDEYEITFNYKPTGTIGDTGASKDYMPEYMTIYAWRRTG